MWQLKQQKKKKIYLLKRVPRILPNISGTMSLKRSLTEFSIYTNYGKKYISFRNNTFMMKNVKNLNKFSSGKMPHCVISTFYSHFFALVGDFFGRYELTWSK